MNKKKIICNTFNIIICIRVLFDFPHKLNFKQKYGYIGTVKYIKKFNIFKKKI